MYVSYNLIYANYTISALDHVEATSSPFDPSLVIPATVRQRFLKALSSQSRCARKQDT